MYQILQEENGKTARNPAGSRSKLTKHVLN